MDESAYTKVTILGDDYRITGDSAASSIRELATFVDDKMEEVKRHSGSFDVKRIAVLTALNLADELFRERRRSVTQEGAVRERVEQLGFVLEDTLTDPE